MGTLLIRISWNLLRERALECPEGTQYRSGHSFLKLCVELTLNSVTAYQQTPKRALAWSFSRALFRARWLVHLLTSPLPMPGSPVPRPPRESIDFHICGKPVCLALLCWDPSTTATCEMCFGPCRSW